MEMNTFIENEVTEFEFNSYHRMPSKNHSKLQTRLARLLDEAYENDYDILTTVEIDLPTGKSVPDVSIYQKMLFDWSNDEIRLTTPPITTIEILSPRQALTDLTDKNNVIYFPGGVKSSWIVIPLFKQIHVILPNGKVLAFTSGLLKDPATGIEISLDEVFK